MKYKLVWIINYIYSGVWIALNHSDKYNYRNKSKFYNFVVKEFSLNEKCSLFGFSRGGLYAFRCENSATVADNS